jgi:hypothetical protein
VNSTCRKATNPLTGEELVVRDVINETVDTTRLSVLRAYNGQDSSWYQAAVRENAGRIEAAGMMKEVTFEPVNGSINDRIDDAYREKYEGSSYLSAMISERARSVTVKVMPRNTDA